MNDRTDGTDRVRDYVRQRMSGEMPPDFVGEVMHEVRQIPQRGRWRGWPVVAGLATVAAAVAAVGIGLSLVQPGGVGSGTPSPEPTVSFSGSPAPSTVLESAAPSFAPEPSLPGPDPSALPAGPHGPVWGLAPDDAFPAPTSCENPAGLPTAEEGENVAWRISFPADWTTQESYIGPCLWFGALLWEPDLEDATPPDEVVIVISLLDQRVTPTSSEFEGGTVTAEDRYTVDGLPAIRYVVEGSDGEFLRGDGVAWVIGTEGQLPSFDGGVTPNWMTIYTTATEAGRLVQQIDVLDRMVATLEITDD